MLSVHLEDGRVEVRDVPIPERPPGHALIRMLAAGICNTDLELQRGYYGFKGTPGHEFAGEVVEADSPKWIGRRVAGEINLGCGACDWCSRRLSRHCPHRTVLGIVNHPGAFQEFFTLPESNLLAIPDSISTEEAVFIEPLAAACEILDQVHVPCGSTVAVLGDGKLGLLIVQLFRAYGFPVVHFGHHASKLALSAKFGARTSVDSPPRASFDWVVDATGSSGGLSVAIHAVRPRGTLILKSTVHDHASIDWAHVIVNELSLIGSRCGRFEPAVELLRHGTIQVGALISERFSLADTPAAFSCAARKGALKVIVNG
jgi:alcohol dehydrogenase